jgi:hypothetical protein
MQLYWVSSRGQPAKGGPPWWLGNGITSPYRRKPSWSSWSVVNGRGQMGQGCHWASRRVSIHFYKLWTGFIWLRIGTSGGCCEHGSEPPGSIRGRSFLSWPSDCQFSKKTAPWCFRYTCTSIRPRYVVYSWYYCCLHAKCCSCYWWSVLSPTSAFYASHDANCNVSAYIITSVLFNNHFRFFCLHSKCRHIPAIWK